MMRSFLAALGLAAAVQGIAPPPGSAYGAPGNASYDYVVVGGGTAGVTVATRLAQDGRFSVALVEAGGFYEIENSNHSVIPGYAFYGLAVPSNPLVEWGFFTEPQKGAGNKTFPYVRGRTLGGSSAFNLMLYQRPTVGAMQKWADDVGDQSWTWNNVLKYFARSSTFNLPPKSRPQNATPGYDESVFANGPVQTSYSTYSSPVAGWFLKAAQALGLTYAAHGFQSGHLLGNGWTPSTVTSKTGVRSSSQEAYLQMGLETQRLTVYTHSFAKKLVFDGLEATGVQVATGQLPFILTAKREVIVSCGAFQSPQLLMVSGIGPRPLLQNLSIPIVAERSGVGQNMWDNPIFGPSYAVDVETSSAFTNDPAKMAQAVEQYNANRTGYLSSSSAEVISFESLRSVAHLNLSASAKRDLDFLPEDWPDVELASFQQWFGPVVGSKAPTDANYESFGIGLIAPLSRGQVTIRSADMTDAPIINPNWLTHPTDQEIAVAAVRRAREYANTPAFQSIIIGDEAFPGSNVTSYDDILRFLQNQASTYYHASATCKMGKADDRMAVVDSKAKVIGVERLRVVDVSAMPFLPPGQPQATVYMLAEKIAAEILTSAVHRSNNGSVRSDLA